MLTNLIEREGRVMKKSIAFLFVFLSVFASSVFAGGICPQERKTAAAPANIAAMDETAGASLDRGKALYQKDAKPIVCKHCHGEAGDGTGKLGLSLKPLPLNFTCADTMKNISAGQMFHIIKNGSAGTGMSAHDRSLSDKDIWATVKYIRSTFMR